MRARRIVVWGLLVLMAVSLAGCVKGTDPETGKPTYNVDPNKAGEVEKTVETMAVVLSLLGGIWPVLIPIGTGALGVLAAWRKMKPKLVEVQTEAELYHTLGLATIVGIDKFKELYPNEWAKLLTELEAVKNKIIKPDDRLKIENVIRALRGLPPKE